MLRLPVPPQGQNQLPSFEKHILKSLYVPKRQISEKQIVEVTTIVIRHAFAM